VTLKEEDLMRIMKGATIALALVTTSLATAGAAGADPYFGNDSYRGYYNGQAERNQYDRQMYDRVRYESRHRRHHATVAIQFGNVSYRDGYWDNDHRWHRGHHDRNNRGDNGWQRP
jgi:hypothetical protein